MLDLCGETEEGEGEDDSVFTSGFSLLAYEGTGEGEDDSVFTSGFSLLAYAARTKHHKRKLGSKPAAVAGMMPVRMGARGGVKKAAPTNL